MRRSGRDAVSVEALPGYRLRLRFADGAEGEVDVSELIAAGGVFAPLRDWGEFAKVRVNPEFGCVCWSEQVDLCPDTVYAVATTGRPPGPEVDDPGHPALRAVPRR